MSIEIKTDSELIALWEQLTSKMNKNRTAIGATQELRVLMQIHSELAKRGYRPKDSVWVKDEGTEHD
jgi:hypothetical protein